MFKITITGKVNLKKIKRFVEDSLSGRLEAMLDEPELQAAQAEVSVVVDVKIAARKKSRKRVVILKQDFSYGNLDSFTKNVTKFYDDVLIECKEVETPSEEDSEFELTVGDSGDILIDQELGSAPK